MVENVMCRSLVPFYVVLYSEKKNCSYACYEGMWGIGDMTYSIVPLKLMS
jgi:hypothetical protein